MISFAHTVRTAFWSKKKDYKRYTDSLREASKGYKVKPLNVSLESLGFENRTKK